jgi:hypothetical protein
MRLLRVVEPELVGDRQEASVVVAACARGVTDTAGGGDSVHGLVQQPFEGELGAAGGRGLSDQGLGGGQIRQFGVVPLNIGPRDCQFGGKNWWCRAHVVTTSRERSVFRFRGIPNNLHSTVSSE